MSAWLLILNGFLKLSSKKMRPSATPPPFLHTALLPFLHAAPTPMPVQMPAAPLPFLLTVNLHIPGHGCHNAIPRPASTTSSATHARGAVLPPRRQPLDPQLQLPCAIPRPASTTSAAGSSTMSVPSASIIDLDCFYNRTAQIRGDCKKFSCSHSQAIQSLDIYIIEF